jgi:hypothetical protein
LTSICFLNQDRSYNYSYMVSFSTFIPIIISLFILPLIFSMLFFFIF